MNNEDIKLNVREKIALYLLLAIFKVLKPADWNFTKDIDTIHNLIRYGKEEKDGA